MDIQISKHATQVWTRDQVKLTRPEPYEDPSIWAVNTIHFAGVPITFLAYQQSLNEDLWEATLYAIEAPVTCPRRVAFESSKLSWLDFWLEREWLLYITFPLYGGNDVTTQYITPHDVCAKTIERFGKLGMIGPYERKRQSLEHWLETSSWNGECPKKCEKNYRDFVTRNAMRLPKNAA